MEDTQQKKDWKKPEVKVLDMKNTFNGDPQGSCENATSNFSGPLCIS
ncbi:hypothetical protein OAO55_01910 [Bacteroidales bacterium]|nr:hypothetical protein [Bacteroidales bacterium]